MPKLICCDVDCLGLCLEGDETDSQPIGEDGTPNNVPATDVSHVAPVLAGGLPTKSGTSPSGTPDLASDPLAAGLQAMKVDTSCNSPAKAPQMSVWDSILQKSIVAGDGMPDDLVIMAVDDKVKIEVREESRVPIFGHLGRILHRSKRQKDQTDYLVAVLVVVDDAGTTISKLLQVLRGGFDIISQEENVIASGTQLESGEPAEGAVCGMRPPRDYTAQEVPDLEFPDSRRRTLTAILQLYQNLFSVKLD